MRQIVSMKFLKVAILCSIALGLFCVPAIGQHKVDVSRQFIVRGAVDNPIVFDISAIKKYVATDLGDVVVKNHRGRDKKVAKNVKGVLLKTMLDSVHVKVDKPKQYSELLIVLMATDGYKNVYSWNELMNTDVGYHVFVITEKDGKSIEEMDDAIVVISMSDINPGSRYLRGFSKLEIRKVE